MFNVVLKSGVPNTLPLNEVEQKSEQTSLPQVETAAQRWSKSPRAPHRESLAPGRKICSCLFVRLRMWGCSQVFFCSQITGRRRDLQTRCILAPLLDKESQEGNATRSRGFSD